jgi:oligopeptidase B
MYITFDSTLATLAVVQYPNMLVTGGLYDSRVAFWEPLKWVAKLRELKTDNNLLLCKVRITCLLCFKCVIDV